MAKGNSGRKRKLTTVQEIDLLRRYALYLANVPKVLAADFGISPTSINHYVRRARGFDE